MMHRPHYRLVVVTAICLLATLTASAPADQTEILCPWTDMGEVLPGEIMINTLLGTQGGKIVGGSYGSGAPYLFEYDPRTGWASPKMLVPGTGEYVARLAEGPDGLIYLTTKGGFGQGDLASYDAATKTIVNLGTFQDDYGEGLAVGLDGKVYVGTCCKGYLSIYDPQTSAWTYLGQILPDQVRIGGLAFGADGNLYGVTSRIWIPPWGGATLFKFDLANQTATTVGTVWPGAHECWNLVSNPVDHRLYGTVSYHMTPRLFAFDPAHPELGIRDLGATPGRQTDIGHNGLLAAWSGKIIALASRRLVAYDPSSPEDGIVVMRSALDARTPMTFAKDHLYATSRSQPTHLIRNCVPWGE
jgi:hypothetical protein